jgi:hypothetical protein
VSFRASQMGGRHLTYQRWKALSPLDGKGRSGRRKNPRNMPLFVTDLVFPHAILRPEGPSPPQSRANSDKNGDVDEMTT